MHQQSLKARSQSQHGILLNLLLKSIYPLTFVLSLCLSISSKESDGTWKETISQLLLITSKHLLKSSFTLFQKLCLKSLSRRQKVFLKQWSSILQDPCSTFVMIRMFFVTIFRNRLFQRNFNQEQEWYHQSPFIQKETISSLDRMIKRSCGSTRTLRALLIKSSNTSKKQLEGLTSVQNTLCLCPARMTDQLMSFMAWSIQRL